MSFVDLISLLVPVYRVPGMPFVFWGCIDFNFSTAGWPFVFKFQLHRTSSDFTFRHPCSPSGCGCCLGIPGVSQVEKGEHRTQAFLLCMCAYVRFAYCCAAAVRLYSGRMLLKFEVLGG